MAKKRSHPKSGRSAQLMSRLVSQSAAYNAMISEFKVLKAEWERTHQDIIIKQTRSVYTVFNNKHLLAKPHISKDTQDYLMRNNIPRVEAKNRQGEVVSRIY